MQLFMQSIKDKELIKEFRLLEFNLLIDSIEVNNSELLFKFRGDNVIFILTFIILIEFEKHLTRDRVRWFLTWLF